MITIISVLPAIYHYLKNQEEPENHDPYTLDLAKNPLADPDTLMHLRRNLHAERELHEVDHSEY